MVGNKNGWLGVTLISPKVYVDPLMELMLKKVNLS